MKLLFLIICFFIKISLVHAQSPVKNKDTCICQVASSIKFPEIGDEDSLKYGKVIASFEIDTNCLCGYVKVEQSLSTLHDAAVLKAMNNFIIQHNKCITKCPLRNCKKQKLFIPFNFSSPDDE